MILYNKDDYSDEHDFDESIERECTSATAAGKIGLGPTIVADGCWTCSTIKPHKLPAALIVMQDLADAETVAETTLTLSEADWVLPSLVAGLDKLHQEGWLHGDVHSGNVMMAKDGNRAWLIDYGKARRVLDTDRGYTLAQVAEMDQSEEEEEEEDPKAEYRRFEDTARTLLENKWVPGQRRVGTGELEDFYDLLSVFDPDLWQQQQHEPETFSWPGSSRKSTDGRGSSVLRSRVVKTTKTQWWILARQDAPRARIRGIVLRRTTTPRGRPRAVVWVYTTQRQDAEALRAVVSQHVPAAWPLVWRVADEPVSADTEYKRLARACRGLVPASPGPTLHRLTLRGSFGSLWIETILDKAHDAVVTIVRDDLVCGGTKSRFVPALLQDYPHATEFVYASSWYDGAQIALAAGLRRVHTARATIVTADWKKGGGQDMPLMTRVAQEAGAHIVTAPSEEATYDVARQYVAAEPERRVLVPSGFDTPRVRQALTSVARQVLEQVRDGQPWDVCYSVCGSGTLQRCLQSAGVAKAYVAVGVVPGQRPDIGQARYIAPSQALADPVSNLDAPPFPSAIYYDAKAWSFVRGQRGHVLFWNVM